MISDRSLKKWAMSSQRKSMSRGSTMAGVSLATWAALASAGAGAYSVYSTNETGKDQQRAQQAGIAAQQAALAAKPQAPIAPNYMALRTTQGIAGGSNATTLL